MILSKRPVLWDTAAKGWQNSARPQWPWRGWKGWRRMPGRWKFAWKTRRRDRDKMKRSAGIERKTRETDISLTLGLDGGGNISIQTGVGFFDHLLTHLAFHGALDLKLKATGDLEVDAHHTVEDVGLVFGRALVEALGDRKSITRYGSAVIPMADALVLAAVDWGS